MMRQMEGTYKYILLTGETKAVENLLFLGRTFSCCEQFSQNTNRSIIYFTVTLAVQNCTWQF